MSGKGDKRRKEDSNKFRKNYDKIFGKRDKNTNKTDEKNKKTRK